MLATNGGAFVTVGLPVPMPRESEVPSNSAHLAITAMDGRGRLADRSPVRVLNWSPRQQIWLAVHQNVIVVMADACVGTLTSIDSQGFLRLPAHIRGNVRLEAGNQLLVLAERERNALAVYSHYTVCEALLSAAPDIWVMP